MPHPGFAHIVRGLLVAAGLFLLILQIALASKGPGAPPVVDRLLPVIVVAR